MKSDQFAKDINFNKVVFLHLNRTGTSIMEPLLFIANVEWLEILLSPYIDDDYKSDIKNKKLMATSISALDPMLKTKTDMTKQTNIETAVHNARCLMSLAERKGLLLEKTSSDEEWLLEEEEPNDTEMEE